MDTFILTKLVSRTCFVSLSGSFSTQDYFWAGQGRAITESLDLGEGDGEQGRDIPSAQEGPLIHIPREHTSSHWTEVQGNPWPDTPYPPQ